jgi:hypothetical protein
VATTAFAQVSIDIHFGHPHPAPVVIMDDFPCEPLIINGARVYDQVCISRVINSQEVDFGYHSAEFNIFVSQVNTCRVPIYGGYYYTPDCLFNAHTGPWYRYHTYWAPRHVDHWRGWYHNRNYDRWDHHHSPRPGHFEPRHDDHHGNGHGHPGFGHGHHPGFGHGPRGDLALPELNDVNDKSLNAKAQQNNSSLEDTKQDDAGPALDAQLRDPLSGPDAGQAL